jgi:hypothetical protein
MIINTQMLIGIATKKTDVPSKTAPMSSKTTETRQTKLIARLIRLPLTIFEQCNRATLNLGMVSPHRHSSQSTHNGCIS